jgi:hypothetical protein
MRKLKDELINDYTIKIGRLREVEKGDGYVEHIDKFFTIDIIGSCGEKISFFEKMGNNYTKSLRKVFMRIQEEIHINRI